MPLIALGINHRSAPVELRERIAFSGERMSDALRELAGLPVVEEAAILSTCNRTELYCRISDSDAGNLTEWLGQYHRIDPASLEPHLYCHPGAEAVRHLLRVAGGLDSMILGEPQILGQVKEAYQRAAEAGTLDTQLERLFQHTFAVAKQIRTDTAIGESPVSVAFAAVSLARQIFSDFEEHTALLIGAGETIELAARHLHDMGLGRMIVANRTLERAHDLAAQYAGYGIGLDEIPAHLAEADIVIASTGSREPLLTRAQVKQALRARRHKPVFMVDIAVPRDIEPAVGRLEDVYLYSIDDLQEVIQENLKSREQAAAQAEEIVDIQVDRFMAWLRGQDAVASIRRFRSRAEQERDRLLDKARQQLAAGQPPDKVLEQLANGLTNTLIHGPTTRLRQAGEEGRLDLLQAASELFRLKDE